MRLSRGSFSPRRGLAALLVGAVAGLVSSPIAAQGIRSAAEEAREGEEIRGNTGVAEIREVERGLYLSIDAGVNYYLPLEVPGFVVLNQGWLTPGTRMGMRLGYDILNNLNAELFVLGNFNQGQLDPESLRTGKLTGDLSHISVGAGGRFAFVTTERLFVYTRGGIGYAFWFPQELAHGSLGSIHTDASLGVEYYTRLRHLSVGMELAAQALLLPFSVGFQVYPTVKYTF